jgi:probable rRNA maturation factor
MNIVIANRQRAKKINKRLLKQIVSELFAEIKISDAKLGINFVAVSEMASVNEAFLKHKGSTDVITFDYADKTEGTIIAGEIFICMDEAIVHARKFRTKWQSEIIRYIVHGILHLLGHDDLRAGFRRKMKREENRLLRELSRRFVLSKL